MATVYQVTDEQTFRSTIASLPKSHLAVVYFQAPWAKPCQQMSEILSTLARQYDATAGISFYSLDAEELNELAEQYEVSAVPLVILQKDGKKLQQVTGCDAPKLRAAVEAHYVAGGAAAQQSMVPPAQKVTRPPEGQEATPVPTTTDAPTANKPAPLSINDVSALTADKPAATAKDSPIDNNEIEDKEALTARLRDLTSAAPVMLFMKGTPSEPRCGFSSKIVKLLRDRSIRYGFFNILADDAVRQGLKEFSEWPTYPQLYVEGSLVGGLDIVTEEFEKNPGFWESYSANSAPIPT